MLLSALFACSEPCGAANSGSPDSATETGSDSAPSDSAIGAAAGHFRLHGATVVGLGLADVEIEGARIVAVGAAAVAGEVIDLTGRWLVPAFIDSHVHLAYDPRGEELATGGVAGAVDLAAPVAFLAASHGPIQLIASGPMITAPAGYPTRGWGRNGYGMECSSGDDAVAAVDVLIDAGAGVIKLPITTGPQLDAAAQTGVVARAHARGVKVASHALSDVDAAAAALAGVDVLAHTPTEPLSATTLRSWSSGAVVSSLLAFGGGADTVANLSALRGAGARVLYGTDFGNTRTAGIDPGEIALMMQAGLDGAAILAAGTSAPAAYWGFADLGEITVGKAASLLVLAQDPMSDPATLASAEQVWIDGVRRR